MARAQFGGTLNDLVQSAAHGPTLMGATVWTAKTGGSQITDLQDADGDAMTTIGVEALKSGYLQFQGPDDNTTTVWLETGSGPRTKMVADYSALARLSALATPPRCYFLGALSTATSAPMGSVSGRRCSRVVGSGLITKIGLYVGTSSGNVDVAVHRPIGTGVTQFPDLTAAAVSGSVACPAGAAYAEIALTASIYVNDGDWFSVGADNTTATFASFSAGVVQFHRSLLAIQTTGFPASTSVAAGANGASTTGIYLIGIP